MPVRSAKAPQPSVANMLAADARPVPDVLLDRGEAEVPNRPIAKQRYFDPAFAERERSLMWNQTWQMVCRLDDIPKVGDYQLYSIGERSWIVVRTGTDEVRAYVNACLHRGRALRDDDGHAEEFRCPFHGFAWRLDGTCAHLINGWDFDHVDQEAFSLPEAKVDTWGGFVFLHPQRGAEPLDEFLENIPEIYRTRGWDLSERVKTVHVRKINRCNWKVALEAFIESFHVTETHSSATTYLGDANTQYDVWPGKKHTRMISPRGLNSPNIPSMDERAVYRAGMRASMGDRADTIELPEGISTARAAMAAQRRELLDDQGIPFAGDASDSELVDTIQYHIFPNLVCWAGWGSYLVYRFLPLGTDPDMSTMDIMFLSPAGDARHCGPPQIVGPDASLHEAPQLGGYCSVFDEDSSNLPSIQRGLKSMAGIGPITGHYQEARIRHFHSVIDAFLDAGS